MPAKFDGAMRRLAAALLLAFTVGLSGATLRAQEIPTVKIAAPANDTATSAIYAVKAGLFKRAGLNVEITPMASGAAVAAAVAGGAVQFGNSSLVTLIEAHAKHLPFTLVATSGMIETNVPYAAFVVRKDASLKTARDLSGKTIATPALKDLNAISIMAWTDQNGGDSSSLRFIELSAAASLQAIGDGRVDAAILGTPVLTQGLETGQIRVFAKAFDAVAKRFIHIGWFTTEDYAAKNRDVVERFARVMHDAAVYCNAHQAETVDMIAEFGKLDPAVVRGMARVTFAEYLTAPEIQPLVDVAVKYKVIDRSFSAQELISPYALKPPSRRG